MQNVWEVFVLIPSIITTIFSGGALLLSCGYSTAQYTGGQRESSNSGIGNSAAVMNYLNLSRRSRCQLWNPQVTYIRL